MGRTLSRTEALEVLRRACTEAGGVSAWARAHGFAHPTVFRVLARERPPSPRLLEALGLVREQRYRYRKV